MGTAGECGVNVGRSRDGGGRRRSAGAKWAFVVGATMIRGKAAPVRDARPVAEPLLGSAPATAPVAQLDRAGLS